MANLETLPNWVQDNASVEDGTVEFSSFAKAKFFLLDKQVTPYGPIEFPEEVKDSLMVSGDDSMVVNGFSLEDTSEPNRLRVRTNSNVDYDVRYLTNAVILQPEIDGDDITLTMADEKTTPGGDPITKMVISPLSEDELKVVMGSYGR